MKWPTPNASDHSMREGQLPSAHQLSELTCSHNRMNSSLRSLSYIGTDWFGAGPEVSAMCLLVSSYDFYLSVFILILSVILHNFCSYPIGILKWEHTLNSFSDIFALLSPSLYDLLHNYILTNNNYSVAVNRTRDLIVRGT